MPVPVDFHTVFARVRRTLQLYQKTLAMVEEEPGEFAIFECELKDKGKVRLVPDLEALARSLGVMEDCETPGGDWAASRQ